MLKYKINTIRLNQFFTIPLLFPVAVLGYWLSFPNPFIQLPILVLLFPIALLYISINAESKFIAFRQGVSISLIANALCLYWIAVPIHDFGQLPWLVGISCVFILSFYFAFFFAFFTLLVYIVVPKLSKFSLGIFCGTTWACFEYLRGFLLSGFPWLPLASAFAPWTFAVQGLSLIGIYALSGIYFTLSVWVGLLIFNWLKKINFVIFNEKVSKTIYIKKTDKIFTVFTLVIIVIFFTSYSGYSIYNYNQQIKDENFISEQVTMLLEDKSSIENEESDAEGRVRFLIQTSESLVNYENTNSFNAGEEFNNISKLTGDNFEIKPSIKVILVQGNIDQSQKWDTAYQFATITKYINLTKQGLTLVEEIDSLQKNGQELQKNKNQNTHKLAIWPETAMPFFYQSSGIYKNMIRSLAKDYKTSIIFGSPDFINIESNNVDNISLFNRAYLISDSGQELSYYDKEHLVPFGEYTPKWINFSFLDFFFQGIGAFEPGFIIKPLEFNQFVFGMLICYETIFPELANQRVNDNANILVNMSNDAWFGQTVAPEQHLQLSLLRAIEQRRWLIRSTNTGISAIINPIGQVMVRTKLFENEVIIYNILTFDQKTIFSNISVYIPYFLFFLSLFLFLFACREHLISIFFIFNSKDK